MKIPISKSDFDQNDFDLVLQPLKTGWVVQGPFVQKFENQFGAFTGSKYSSAVTSCTTALHLALIAAGIEKGDEVIIPAFTWISTANAVEYVGGKVIFCDINLDTYNIDIDQIEQKITPRCKAIIPVHLFGQPVEMNKISELAKKYNLKIIEDAACAFGTYYQNIHVGNFGDAGCFSFHPRKSITTGEGGMITSNNEEFDEKIKALRSHGGTISDLKRHESKSGFLLPEYTMLGYNYRMTDIQGAIGVAQMGKAADLLERRRKKAVIYHELLKKVSWLKLPGTIPGGVHSFQSYVCLYEPDQVNISNYENFHLKRNSLMMELEQAGIATRQGTHAITLQKYYQQKYNIADTSYPNATIADKLTIALPLYPSITQEEQEYVVKNLISIYKKLNNGK